ncbi:MAG: hypothetical protein QG630_450 [Patescibacteria group bacterium]|nr:hypothetical protein [Patescibacteria group bacterium]
MTIFEDLKNKMPNLMESGGDKVAIETKNFLSRFKNLKEISFKIIKEELSKIKDSRVLNSVMKGLAVSTSAFLLNVSDGNAQELKYTKNPDGTISVFKEKITKKVRQHGKETVTITKTFKEDLGTAEEEDSDSTFTIEPHKNIDNTNPQIIIDGNKYQKISQAPDPSLVKSTNDYRKIGREWYKRVSERKEVVAENIIEVEGTKYQKMLQAPDPSLVKPGGDYRKLGNNWYQKVSLKENKETAKQSIINIDGNKYVSCDVAPTKEMISTGDYRKIGQIWYTKYKL